LAIGNWQLAKPESSLTNSEYAHFGKKDLTATVAKSKENPEFLLPLRPSRPLR
jgi:hypothetical protein